MAAPPDFDDSRFTLPESTRLRGLAYRIGQRQQVIVARATGIRVGCQSKDLPPPRSAQTLRMLVAQVVAVGLGKRRQRAEDGRLIGVDVSEGGRGVACTGGARASAGGTHRATLPPSSRSRRHWRRPSPVSLTIETPAMPPYTASFAEQLASRRGKGGGVARLGCWRVQGIRCAGTGVGAGPEGSSTRSTRSGRPGTNGPTGAAGHRRSTAAGQPH
jgi:hypothetical protein